MKHIMLLIAIVVLAGALGGCKEATPHTITVAGFASAATAPEKAIFTFEASHRGRNIPAVSRRVDQETEKVVVLARSLGVEESLITATQMSIYPHYNYKTGKLNAYNVSRSIVVELRDLDKYAELLDGAIKAGITVVGQVQMAVMDPTAQENRALSLALAKARDKAVLMARDYGLQPGAVLEITEFGQAPVHEAGFAAKQEGLLRRREADVVTVFQPGKITLTKSVLVTFTLQP